MTAMKDNIKNLIKTIGLTKVKYKADSVEACENSSDG